MWVDLPEGRDYPGEEEIRKLRAKLRSLNRQKAKEEKSQAQTRPQGLTRAQDEAERIKELQERIRKADKVLTELIANLKAKGLGTEAARLVADAGYKIGEDLEGKTVEDLEAMVEKARELYAALRDLAEKK
jgi:multidrug resistance efflux pump